MWNVFKLVPSVGGLQTWLEVAVARNGHRTQRVDIGSIKTFCAHSENHSFVRAVSRRFERHRTCTTKRRQLTSSAANGASSRNCPQILNQVASNHVENQEFQTARPRGAENDDLLCVVCLTEPKNHACVPCGHLCVCARCGGNVEFVGRKQCLMRSHVPFYTLADHPALHIRGISLPCAGSESGE